MSKESRREELAKKFPEMEEQFQEVKQEIYEPHMARLGQTSKEQKQRGQS